MIWTKGAHQSAKFQTFDCSRKISPNLYFDRLLKVYKILAKKYRGVISHDPEDWCKIWRKTDLLFQKWQEFGEIWPRHSKFSKICTFHWFLLSKVFNVWPKKGQRSYLSWYQRVIQNLKKNFLVVWKMTWGIQQIFTRALRSVKIWTFVLMGSFCPN